MLPRRCRRVPLVLLAAVVVASACSSSANDPSGGSGGPEGTTPASSALGVEATLNGSGATFPKAFYEEAIADFSGGVAPDVVVNYGGGGSGKGKRDLADQIVQWAGTDSLVSSADKGNFKGGAFLYFPTVAAPITVSYNVAGVRELDLSPDTVAGIFQSDITTWDAPEIRADNPAATLPSLPITVVHRSDGSGTTANFTSYLAAAAPDTWRLEPGDSVNWPTSTQAGNGNNGVAQIIAQTDGSIGYVDFSDARATGLTFASIENRDGQFVAPTLEGASAALAGAVVREDLTYDALDASGPDAYPITASTYLIAYVDQPDRALGDALEGWISYLLTDGQDLAPTVDFAPLPDSLRQRAIAQLADFRIG